MISRLNHESRSRSMLRYAAISTASVAGLALAGITGLAAYLSRRISRPRRSHRPPHYTFTPWEFGISYRELTIQVGNDELSAWFLPQDQPDAPCILCLSGFGSHKAELLGISSNLFRDGFSIMLIDFRGAGRSKGDVVTMGHNETEDARAALDWLSTEIPDTPIGVLGYSMGGSVALTLAATDDRVSAVVSDSAFATQRSIFRHHVRRRTGIWPDPVLTLAQPMLRQRHGRSYGDFAPATMVHHIAPRPTFLIHSEDDQVVPFSHAEEIWSNAGEPRQSWFLQGVGHCGAYFHDRPGYCKRVSAFFHESLANAPADVGLTENPAS